MEEGIEIKVGKTKLISRFEQEVMEKFRAQHVYTALTSSPPSHIGGDEERTDSIASIEIGDMVHDIPILVAVRVYANIKWSPFGGIGDYKV